MSSAIPKTWIFQLGVAKTLTVSPNQVPRILAHANVRTRKLPGMRRQYLREDIERIAREAIDGPPDRAGLVVADGVAEPVGVAEPAGASA